MLSPCVLLYEIGWWVKSLQRELGRVGDAGFDIISFPCNKARQDMIAPTPRCPSPVSIFLSLFSSNRGPLAELIPTCNSLTAPRRLSLKCVSPPPTTGDIEPEKASAVAAVEIPSWRRADGHRAAPFSFISFEALE